MAASLPRLGCDNLLWDNRANLRATTELDSDHPVTSIADWFGGTYWKPTFVSNPPADEYIYCYPLTTTNRIDVQNWYFRDWSNGAASAPDGWTLTGAGATIAQNSTAGQFKIDQYAATVTAAAAETKLSVTIPNFEKYVGRRVRVGFHIDADTGGRAKFFVDDGATTILSGVHPGGGLGSYIWANTPIHTVSHDATKLEIGLVISAGAAMSASIDGVAMYITAGSDSVIETPHSMGVNYLAAYDHNFFSARQTVKLQSSDDPADWSNPSNRLVLAPGDDTSTWIDGSTITKNAWRLEFSNGLGPAAVAVMSFGEYIELPEWLLPGTFGPYNRRMLSESPRSSRGFSLGRSIKNTPIQLSLSMPWVSEAFLSGDLQTFWNHAGDSGSPGGLPFFLQWDDGDHAAQTFFCRLPEQANLSAMLNDGLAVRQLTIDVEAAPE